MIISNRLNLFSLFFTLITQPLYRQFKVTKQVQTPLVTAPLVTPVQTAKRECVCKPPAIQYTHAHHSHHTHSQACVSHAPQYHTHYACITSGHAPPRVPDACTTYAACGDGYNAPCTRHHIICVCKHVNSNTVETFTARKWKN